MRGEGAMKRDSPNPAVDHQSPAHSEESLEAEHGDHEDESSSECHVEAFRLFMERMNGCD
jgi:hypothetical protein